MGALQGGVMENVVQLPRQGISVVETCQKINSWAASHEEKWRRVPTKPKDKVQVHKEREIMGSAKINVNGWSRR